MTLQDGIQRNLRGARPRSHARSFPSLSDYSLRTAHRHAPPACFVSPQALDTDWNTPLNHSAEPPQHPSAMDVFGRYPSFRRPTASGSA